jgi:hypothetical protein
MGLKERPLTTRYLVRPEVAADVLSQPWAAPVASLPRVGAATTLGALGADAKEAVPALEAVVKEEKTPRVKTAAEEALKKIRR